MDKFSCVPRTSTYSYSPTLARFDLGMMEVKNKGKLPRTMDLPLSAAGHRPDMSARHRQGKSSPDNERPLLWLLYL